LQSNANVLPLFTVCQQPLNPKLLGSLYNMASMASAVECRACLCFTVALRRKTLELTLHVLINVACRRYQ
ncbi:hypothetical protein T10_3036, partial [Trichinella papuae]